MDFYNFCKSRLISTHFTTLQFTCVTIWHMGGHRSIACVKLRLIELPTCRL